MALDTNVKQLRRHWKLITEDEEGVYQRSIQYQQGQVHVQKNHIEKTSTGNSEKNSESGSDSDSNIRMGSGSETEKVRINYNTNNNKVELISEENHQA